MIIDSYEFRVERKDKNKKAWCCINKDRTKCKARCLTHDQTLEIKPNCHNHGRTFKGHYGNLSSQIWNIERAKPTTGNWRLNRKRKSILNS